MQRAREMNQNEFKNFVDIDLYSFEYTNRLEISKSAHFQLKHLIANVDFSKLIYSKSNHLVYWNSICHTSKKIELALEPSCVAANERFQFVGGKNGEIQIISSLGNQMIIDSNECINHIFLNQKNAMITGNDCLLKFIDLTTMKVEKRDFNFSLNCSASESDLFVVVGDSKEAIVGDYRTREHVFRIEEHQDFMFSCALKANYLATGSEDKTTRLYDLRKIENSIVIPSCSPIRSLKFDEKENLLFVGEHDDYLCIYDLKSLTNCGGSRQKIDFFGELNGFCLSNDSLYFSIAGLDYGGLLEYRKINPYDLSDFCI